MKKLANQTPSDFRSTPEQLDQWAKDNRDVMGTIAPIAGTIGAGLHGAGIGAAIGGLRAPTNHTLEGAVYGAGKGLGAGAGAAVGGLAGAALSSPGHEGFGAAAGAIPGGLLGYYLTKKLIGMPSHDRVINDMIEERKLKKEAYLIPIPIGSPLIGGGLGAYNAPEGEKLKGFGRGAVRGLTTDFGALGGGLAGALGAGALAHTLNLPRELILAGMIPGMIGGGYLGYKLPGPLLDKYVPYNKQPKGQHEPEEKSEHEHKKEACVKAYNLGRYLANKNGY